MARASNIKFGRGHGHIEWKDIPKSAKIKRIGGNYLYKGKWVYWSGLDAIEAQNFLEARVTEAHGRRMF